MRSIAAVLLGLGLLGSMQLSAGMQEKKEDKKDVKKDEKQDEKKDKKDDKKVEPPVLEGKYKMVAGKLNDKPISEDVKKWDYTFTKEKITIKGVILKMDEKKEDKKEEKQKDMNDEKKEDKKVEKKDEKKDDAVVVTFVMSYKLDAKTTPVSIDMEIVEGPEGTKGIKAGGIVELKGDVLKLAYIMEKDKRPKNFEGKEGNMFELQRLK